MLTSRIEFSPLVDAASNFRELHHVTLEPWSRDQWTRYADALANDHPNRVTEIRAFMHQVYCRVYDELPSRPLFLKMLADLEVGIDSQAEQQTRIHPDLRSNLAEVYHRFIHWKLTDDKRRIMGAAPDHAPSSLDVGVGFRILREFANSEYWSSRSADEDSYSEDRPLDQARIMELIEALDLKGFDLASFWMMLNQSSLFSVLRRSRKDGDVFSFSHKSFAEYLFAHNLASCLLEPTSDKRFRNVWGTFQTHEVSAHFQNELIRRRVHENTPVSQQNTAIEARFLNVLTTFKTWDTYDEVVEECLYYAGKLGLQGKEIGDLVRDVLHREKVRLVYIRTASLALAGMDSTSYCDQYVRRLFPKGQQLTDHFFLNRDIQLRYYSEAMIHDRIWPDIETYVSGGDIPKVFSLKLFSYFTCKNSTGRDRQKLERQLKEFEHQAKLMDDDRVTGICDAVRQVWRIEGSGGRSPEGE